LTKVTSLVEQKQHFVTHEMNVAKWEQQQSLLRCQICCMDNKFSHHTNHHLRVLRFWKVLGAWQMKINDVQFGIIPQHNYKWWLERNCIWVGD